MSFLCWGQAPLYLPFQLDPEQLDNLRLPTHRHHRARLGSNVSSGSAKSSVSGFVDKVTALGDITKDITKDMASNMREFGGLTKVTLRSRVIPLDLKKAVSWRRGAGYI